jgi:hypothetical protein
MAAMKNSGLTAEKGKVYAERERKRKKETAGRLIKLVAYFTHTWSAERARVYSPWAYRLTLGTHHSRSRPFNSLLQALGVKSLFARSLSHLASESQKVRQV